MKTNLDVKLHKEIRPGVYQPILLARAKSSNLKPRQDEETRMIKLAGGTIEYLEDKLPQI